MFNGIVFDNRHVRAKDMAVAFQSVINDSILKDCEITATGSDITLGTGFLSIAGRVIQVLSNETITATQLSGYARVKIVIDLSKTSTPEVFEQVYLAIEYSETKEGFSALTQGKINEGNDEIYEAEICTVSLNSSGVNEFESKIRSFTALTANKVFVNGQVYTLRIADEGADGYMTFVI